MRMKDVVHGGIKGDERDKEMVQRQSMGNALVAYTSISTSFWAPSIHTNARCIHVMQ